MIVIGKKIEYIFSSSKRKNCFIDALKEIDLLKSSNVNKSIGELKNEKIECEAFLYSKQSNKDIIFQIITVGIALILFMATLAYYFAEDSLNMLGYTGYIDERFKLIQEIQSNVSNLNSIIVDENFPENANEYEELTNILYAFTSNIGRNTMHISSNQDRTIDLEKDFAEIINIMNNNKKWEIYVNEIIGVEESIAKMNNINKDFAIYLSKQNSINNFIKDISNILISILIVVTLIFSILNGLDDLNIKNKYLVQRQIEVIEDIIRKKSNKDLDILSTKQYEDKREYAVVINSIDEEKLIKKYTITIK